MFCPKCGKEIPSNVAFCPDCGGKLPKIEKNSADVSKMTAEEAGKAAGSGFDTPRPVLVDKQKQINAIAVIGTIVVVAIIGFILYQQDNGGGGFFGTQRSCVINYMSSRPECSDNNGQPETTILNGRNIGTCRVVGNSGCQQR